MFSTLNSAAVYCKNVVCNVTHCICIKSGRVAGQIVDNCGGSGRVKGMTYVGRVGSGSKKVTRVHLWCSLHSKKLRKIKIAEKFCKGYRLKNSRKAKKIRGGSFVTGVVCPAKIEGKF